MSPVSTGGITPKEKRFKKGVVKLVFFILGRSLASASKFDSMTKQEVARWPDGFRILFFTAYHGPSMGLVKKNGHLKREHVTLEDADLIIVFKNVEFAFKLVTVQLGVPAAFAQHRMELKGETDIAMSLIRCLNIAQTYLFPRFIAKRIIRKLPRIPFYKRYMGRARLYLLSIPLGI